MDEFKVEVVWYPDADASVEDVCVDDTEEELMRLWSFPNDADLEDGTW
ncbi:hypothetical protein PCA31118_02581 [Pandoraea captiosa]|jgi:hypothetical protein|uniref:Uncharacterized protein n=1 Tax=Pandoraea captiosa TaxID=2508302 RepID=A0A5E5A2V3_9BURK|nr:hypothetical protein [Pandoraea captiosa]VVE67397.1 hypothetical protein PCA31118_02581 [Pandoraea captiosa]